MAAAPLKSIFFFTVSVLLIASIGLGARGQAQDDELVYPMRGSYGRVGGVRGEKDSLHVNEKETDGGQ
eukprot:scaffold4335_cov119-Cylindrotheca_fusiformis.AAC.8